MERKHQFFVANALVWSLSAFLFVVAKFSMRVQPDWPWWVYLWGGAISFVLFFEIMSRLGPEKFETPIDLLLRGSACDRVVISSAVLVSLTILSIFPPIVINLSPPSIYMVYLVGVLVAPGYLILYFGGSEKLRNSIVPHRIKEAGMRDRIVILLGYLTILIAYSIVISQKTTIWPLLFICFFIMAYISPLFNFVFGSPKLRDEVTPKWLKDILLKINKPKGEE